MLDKRVVTESSLEEKKKENLPIIVFNNTDDLFWGLVLMIKTTRTV